MTIKAPFPKHGDGALYFRVNSMRKLIDSKAAILALVLLGVPMMVWAEGTSILRLPHPELPQCEPDDPDLLLPDLVPDVPGTVFETRKGDHRLIQFTTSVANLGDGPLLIEGRTVSVADGLRTHAWQLINRRDGSRCANAAGTFSFHVAHNHFHFDDYVAYELRSENPVDGPLATIGIKASFCLLDTERVRGFTLPRQLDVTNCDSQEGIYGISVGYKDIYDRTLPEQDVDLDPENGPSVPRGDYFIVNDVDPDNFLWETDDTNNLAFAETKVRLPPMGPVGELPIIPAEPPRAVKGIDDRPTPVSFPTFAFVTPTGGRRVPTQRPTLTPVPTNTRPPRPTRPGSLFVATPTATPFIVFTPIPTPTFIPTPIPTLIPTPVPTQVPTIAIGFTPPPTPLPTNTAVPPPPVVSAPTATPSRTRPFVRNTPGNNGIPVNRPATPVRPQRPQRPLGPHDTPPTATPTFVIQQPTLNPGETPLPTATPTMIVLSSSAPGSACTNACAYKISRMRLEWYRNSGLNFAMTVQSSRECPEIDVPAGTDGTLEFFHWVTEGRQDTGRYHATTFVVDGNGMAAASNGGQFNIQDKRAFINVEYSAALLPIAGPDDGLLFPVAFDVCMTVGNTPVTGRMVCQPKIGAGRDGMLCHEG